MGILTPGEKHKDKDNGAYEAFRQPRPQREFHAS